MGGVATLHVDVDAFYDSIQQRDRQRQRQTQLDTVTDPIRDRYGRLRLSTGYLPSKEDP